MFSTTIQYLHHNFVLQPQCVVMHTLVLLIVFEALCDPYIVHALFPETPKISKTFIVGLSQDPVSCRLWVDSFQSNSLKETNTWRSALRKLGELKHRFMVFYTLLLVFCNLF